MHSTLCEENSWKIQVKNFWEQKLLNWTGYKNIMQTITFGLKFDSLRYDVPLKIRSRSSKHKKLFKLSQWYAQTTTYWFIRYYAFTQEREWGSGTLILRLSLTGSAQKYVPPPLEWGEIKRVVYVWRQTKPNIAASKNGIKRGNKTEFC